MEVGSVYFLFVQSGLDVDKPVNVMGEKKLKKLTGTYTRNIYAEENIGLLVTGSTSSHSPFCRPERVLLPEDVPCTFLLRQGSAMVDLVSQSGGAVTGNREKKKRRPLEQQARKGSERLPLPSLCLQSPAPPLPPSLTWAKAETIKSSSMKGIRTTLSHEFCFPFRSVSKSGG